MVGLVVVSHSRQLAEAACRLAQGVGRNELPLAFAGGAGENREELGTDATDIMEAVKRVDSGDGVVILMDLGSAVLSARLAEQMLGYDAAHIRLCPAPLVEGAVAAAIQIASGASLDTVCDEAKSALAAKAREITGDGPAPVKGGTMVSVVEAIPGVALRFRFAVDDPNGLHTRPAADFVKCVSAFDAEVRIRNLITGSPFVNGKSINQVALSNIQRGDVAEVAVWGPRAQDALGAIRRLVEETYHGSETSVALARAGSQDEDVFPAPTGLEALSPGIAIGRLVVSSASAAVATPTRVADPEAEIRRLEAALETVRHSLGRQRDILAKKLPEAAGILEAQLLILDDGEILTMVREIIRRESLDAASVYQGRMAALADSYRSLANPYMRERAADIGGVAEQVQNALMGKSAADDAPLTEVIVWAPEVTPAMLGRWTPEQLKGILTRDGGITSHVAILARALNIPTITGYAPPAGAKTGSRVVMDTERLQVVVNPSDYEFAQVEERKRAWLGDLERDKRDSRGSVVTRDGVAMSILANVGDEVTARAAMENGAEGIGLLRTEFIYMDRRFPPGEEEQHREMARILAPFAGLPVTVRVLDAGGDKDMPFLDLPHEANPFLGLRGVRLALTYPNDFRQQLRAILRAGVGMDLGVMVPMISTMEEVDFCRSTLETAHRELEKTKTAHAWPIRFGIMVETPAAVLQADEFAERLDFFSIGTNDLTQYVMCAERGSRYLRGLSDGMHPAVLRSVASVVRAAARHGTAVSVCGEMAGDPVAAVALAGMGIRTLSTNSPAIGRIKRVLRSISVTEAWALAEEAMETTSAAAARRLFARLVPK